MTAPDSTTDKARALYEARRTRTAIDPFTDSEPDLGLSDGYAVQNELADLLLADGETIAGYKIGLTSKSMQQMLGVSSPTYGPVFSSTVHQSGQTAHLDSFLQPKVEAEIGLVLGTQLRGPGVTELDARVAIRGAVASMEILDSRIVDWRIKLADTVADLASNGGSVVSSHVVPIEQIDARPIEMSLSKNGSVVASSDGVTALSDAIEVVVGLANVLGEHDTALEAGQVILTGALHAPIDLEAGDVIIAEFDRLGPISINVDPNPTD